MARTNYIQQTQKYQDYDLKKAPGTHMNSKLHLIERELLSWYWSITSRGTKDVKFMSRRAAQVLGIYKYGTKKPQVNVVEKITQDMANKGYVYLYTQGDQQYLKYTFEYKQSDIEVESSDAARLF